MKEIIEHNKYEAPITFDYTLEQAKQIEVEAKKFALTDWQDESTYKEIKKYRTEINGVSKAIYNRKRELKKEAEDWLKKVEHRAKDLSAPIDIAVAHLTAQLNVRDNELERQKNEQETKERLETERRDNLARAIKWDKPIYMLQALTLEEFEKQYQEAKAIHEENEKLAEAQRLRLEQLEKEQKERLDALEKENRLLKESRIVEAEVLAKGDKEMEAVQKEFPTLPLAWAEIIKLRKEMELF